MALVSFVVINVWFFRFNNPTIYRGGKAANMIEEFAVYGLSETIVYVIGGLKVLAAIGLLIGFVNRKAILPSAALMGALMLGAVFMHFKVSDEAIKFLPKKKIKIGNTIFLDSIKKDKKEQNTIKQIKDYLIKKKIKVRNEK